MRKRNVIALLLTTSAGLLLSGCSQADKVSENVSNAADNFQVQRRVVVFNTRTDKIMFVAKGLISIDTETKSKMIILAKTGKHNYKKDIINLTGNTAYTVEDLSGADVSSYSYEVTWQPEGLVPVKIVGDKAK